MKHYEELIELGCFNRKDLTNKYGKSISNKIIYEYQKKGLIEKIKKDFYAVISLESKQPILNKYELASNIFDDAFISYHTAFEYYGYANQVTNTCYVGSARRFKNIEYNGNLYHRIEKKENVDIIYNGKVKVTTLEQTIVDSLNDYEKIMGLEETLRCILLIPSIDENKLLTCLKKKNNGFLYQKCGYVFEEFRNEFNLSNNFFNTCMKHSSKTKQYLIKGCKNKSIYSSKWRLYVPVMDEVILKGEEINAI